MPIITLLLIDPMRDYFKWAIVEGNVLLAQGGAITLNEIKSVARRQKITDVFINDTYRSQEVRLAAGMNGWHCVRYGAVRYEGSIEQLLDVACNFKEASSRKPSRHEQLLAQVASLSRELKRTLSVEEIVDAIVKFDTLKESNA